jgi:predicted nucleic acid-binding protein
LKFCETNPIAASRQKTRFPAGVRGKTYIVASACYSRRKLLDRMIAAQALVHRATLVTFNPDDFSDVPGLSSLVWRLN